MLASEYLNAYSLILRCLLLMKMISELPIVMLLIFLFLSFGLGLFNDDDDSELPIVMLLIFLFLSFGLALFNDDDDFELPIVMLLSC